MSFKKFILVACVVLLAMCFITGCNKNDALIDTDFSSKFSEYEGEEWCEFGDDGSYMIIDTNPMDSDNGFVRNAWNAVEEINIELGFSESVFKKMGETRSLDGRQEEENDKYKVSWTYHPNDGLEVMYENK